ncbi:MAG: hypothetical protein R6V42_05735 [Orrella sp.]
MHSIISKSVRPLALAGLLTLVGCASFSDVKPGTPLSSVVSQHGEPAVTCAGADGTKRVVWTEEPSGEQAWAATVDANGQVTGFAQVLTEDNFKVLNQGSWDTTKLRCQFGPPANVRQFSDHPDHEVWEYHYLGQADGSFMMLSVTVQKGSDKVLGYSTGPDPTLNPLVMGG